MFNLIEWIYLKQKNNLVYHDALTKVKTRFYYENVLKNRYRRKECLIIYADINNLKLINDKYGHSQGDKVIKRVGKHLIKIIGRDNVCRMGGDEFLIFAPFNFKIPDKVINCTIGYHIKQSYESVAYAVNKADSMMYENKREYKLQSKYN